MLLNIEILVLPILKLVMMNFGSKFHVKLKQNEYMLNEGNQDFLDKNENFTLQLLPKATFSHVTAYGFPLSSEFHLLGMQCVEEPQSISNATHLYEV